MPFAQSVLREDAVRTMVRRSLEEASLRREPTAFLSHSHKDATLAKGLQNTLRRLGWQVYIDWEDSTMPDPPDRATADNIRRKIRELDLFLFLATQNSVASRWCPWELGYADGEKPNDTILIVQTQDDQGKSYGNEYLELYRHIEPTQRGGVGSFFKRQSGRRLEGVGMP